ncbi:CLUMA_CG012415, isoform A [Clunio marinus]|uniref:CLUMA_CG012415, isoform A n=1 Tax=Clunio marinus TaxID=568069 RepID=A0A1J1II26_9DIPT|nr:CLUMA_CG012415, isoform A [Clunio marinus]
MSRGLPNEDIFIFKLRKQNRLTKAGYYAVYPTAHSALINSFRFSSFHDGLKEIKKENESEFLMAMVFLPPKLSTASLDK